MNFMKGSEEISEVDQQIIVGFPYQSKKQHESKTNLAWKFKWSISGWWYGLFSHSIDFSSGLNSVKL